MTTNDEAVVIREVHYGEDGVITEVMELDPDSGVTKTSRYEDPNKRETVTRDADGSETERVVYDEEGRVIRRETVEDFASTAWEFSYDKEGRIIQANRVESSGIRESVEFDYDCKGRLRRASRSVLGPQGMAPDSYVEFDEHGEITDATGDHAALVELVNRLLAAEYGDTNGHTTRDHHGNRIRVRHNRDGSYDVEIVNAGGRLVLREYYQSGRCYLGDECPFRNAVPN